MSRGGRRAQRSTAARACAVGLVSLALAGCAGRSRAAASPASAADWRQVAIADLGGHAVTLPAALAGHPALVNLWAPWCERCKTELPDLDRLSHQLDGCGQIVGVAVGEDAAHTAAFVRDRRLSYPQYVDESFRLADALGQSRVPTTLVFDGDGAIVHVGLALDEAAIGALKVALARADAEGRCAGGRAAGSAGVTHEPSWRTSMVRGHDAAALASRPPIVQVSRGQRVCTQFAERDRP